MTDIEKQPGLQKGVKKSKSQTELKFVGEKKVADNTKERGAVLGKKKKKA